MRYFIRWWILSILLGCNHPESTEYLESQDYILQSFKEDNTTIPKDQGFESIDYFKVIGIKDGDTVVLMLNGEETPIRLAHIDSPEKGQPFGYAAKQFVSDLCFGREVILLSENKKDRNGRLIAEIILEDGTNMNKEVIRAGLGWHYKKYSEDKEYADLEYEARTKRIGLWADKDPVAPWEWRKMPKNNR